MTTKNSMVTTRIDAVTFGRDRNQGLPAWQADMTDTTQAFDQQKERYPQSRARAGEDERLNPDGLTATRGTVQTTTETNNGCVCSCGKTLKNEHGLKINRGRISEPEDGPVQ